MFVTVCFLSLIKPFVFCITQFYQEELGQERLRIEEEMQVCGLL